jgi:hypothetical protein
LKKKYVCHGSKQGFKRCHYTSRDWHDDYWNTICWTDHDWGDHFMYPSFDLPRNVVHCISREALGFYIRISTNYVFSLMLWRKIWKSEMLDCKELEKKKQNSCVMKLNQVCRSLHESDDPSFCNGFINFILTVHFISEISSRHRSTWLLGYRSSWRLTVHQQRARPRD